MYPSNQLKSYALLTHVGNNSGGCSVLVLSMDYLIMTALWSSDSIVSFITYQKNEAQVKFFAPFIPMKSDGAGIWTEVCQT